MAFGWFVGPSGGSGRKTEGMEGKIRIGKRRGREERTQGRKYGGGINQRLRITARCLNFQRGGV